MEEPHEKVDVGGREDGGDVFAGEREGKEGREGVGKKNEMKGDVFEELARKCTKTGGLRRGGEGGHGCWGGKGNRSGLYHKMKRGGAAFPHAGD